MFALIAATALASTPASEGRLYLHIQAADGPVLTMPWTWLEDDLLERSLARRVRRMRLDRTAASLAGAPTGTRHTYERGQGARHLVVSLELRPAYSWSSQAGSPSTSTLHGSSSSMSSVKK